MLLLDTNVLSELRKVRGPRVNARFAAWAEAMDPASVRIPAMALYELELGILRMERKDPRQGAALRSWFTYAVLGSFAGRIEPITAEIAREAARLMVPRTRNQPDAFIAATSIVLNMPLVTRNVKHFRPMGVRVINPWEA
jgi:hypothetical protein